MAVVVDPRFPARLRRLRTGRGLSLRELARLAYLAKSTLSDLENGRKRPGVDTARVLDRVLEAAGELAGLVTDAGDRVDAGLVDVERVGYALAHPLRLDAGAVEALAAVLAAQRRLDDQCSPHALVGWVADQRRSVLTLVRAARGRQAERLVPVVAEWTQFHGWLLAQCRRDADAVTLLEESAERADGISAGPLVSQAACFRGWLARQQERPRAIARHFLTAMHTPGATGLQRADGAVQAAHGLALLGDVRGARQLLTEATDLIERHADEPAPTAAYWLSPTYQLLNLGLAYLGLGERHRAADHLRSGLDALPKQWRGAAWTQEYREALTTAAQ